MFVADELGMVSCTKTVILRSNPITPRVQGKNIRMIQYQTRTTKYAGSNLLPAFPARCGNASRMATKLVAKDIFLPD